MNQRIQVCDLNAIETRVGAWVAGCDSLLNVFQPYTDSKGVFHRNGKDSYVAFATNIFGLPYDVMMANKDGENGKEAKSEGKRRRQFGKIGVLGSIYRMGGGQWGNGKASYIDPETGKRVFDRIRTGLWGFAWGQGVETTQEESHMIVRVFRESYPEIVEMWRLLEDAIMDVLKGVNTIRRLGPGGCIVIDKVSVLNRDPILRITLPSGRRLHYFDARIENLKMPWEDRDGGPVYRDGLVYACEDDHGNWTVTTAHGGKTFENIVQGIARDILACKLLDFEAADIPVVGHVHDEGITMVSNDPFSPGLADMVEIMSTPIGWAPGLLLGADGFEDSIYRK